VSCATSTQLAPDTLCDMADLDLLYYIHGKRNVLSVCVSSNENILFLKRKVYDEASRTFIGCDTPDLVLTKVRYIMVL